MKVAQEGAQRDEFEGLTVEALRALAAKLGIRKVSRLRKSALIDAILAVPPQNPDLLPKFGTRPELDNGKADTACQSFSFVVLGPRQVFASWDLAAVDVERARAELGAANPIVVLRIHDRTLIEFDDSRTVATFDIDVCAPAGNYYVNDLFPGRSYQGVLGLRASDDRFYAFAESEILETPRDGVSSVTDRRVMEVHGAPSQRWQARAEPTVRESRSVVLTRDSGNRTDPTVVADAAVDVERVGALSPGTTSALESSSSSDEDALSSGSVGAYGAAVVAAEATVRPESSGLSAEAPLVDELADLGLSSMAPVAAMDDLPSSLSLAEMRERGVGVSSLGLLPLGDRTSEGPDAAVQVDANEEDGALHLDIHADLVVYGRTAPGAVLYVDDVRVFVREDGTFDARFALKGSGRDDVGTGASTR